MVFINLYDILNAIDNTLEKVHPYYDNSFVDNFIDELKSALHTTNTLEELKKLPADTLFMKIAKLVK